VRECVRECVRVCERVCESVRECERVCESVRECVRECLDAVLAPENGHPIPRAHHVLLLLPHVPAKWLQRYPEAGSSWPSWPQASQPATQTSLLPSCSRFRTRAGLVTKQPSHRPRFRIRSGLERSAIQGSQKAVGQMSSTGRSYRKRVSI